MNIGQGNSTLEESNVMTSLPCFHDTSRRAESMTDITGIKKKIFNWKNGLKLEFKTRAINMFGQK